MIDQNKQLHRHPCVFVFPADLSAQLADWFHCSPDPNWRTNRIPAPVELETVRSLQSQNHHLVDTIRAPLKIAKDTHAYNRVSIV